MKQLNLMGYIAVIGWLLYLLYGYTNFDEIRESERLSLVVAITFLGLVWFPVYFILVAVIGLRNNKTKR